MFSYLSALAITKSLHETIKEKMNSSSALISPNHQSFATPRNNERNSHKGNSSPPAAFFGLSKTPQFSPIDVNVRTNNMSRKTRNDENGSAAFDQDMYYMNDSVSSSFHQVLMKTPSPIQVNQTHSTEEQELRDESQLRELELNQGREDVTSSQSNEEETDEERRMREEEESLALARQLMAEEAMASYHQHSQFLQSNAEEYSEEDLAALRAVMQEENPQNIYAPEEEEEEMDSADMSYDALLDLGERIGDVKAERWAMRSEQEIAKLPLTKFCMSMAEGKDENDSGVKCLVCQFAFEENETIRHLPCKHYFHNECVDVWLASKDFCPYCRQCIVIDS